MIYLGILKDLDPPRGAHNANNGNWLVVPLENEFSGSGTAANSPSCWRKSI